MNKKSGLLISLGWTVVILLLMLLDPAPLRMVEDKLLDYRFKLRGKVDAPENVVIADIDEKSLYEFGRWPWDRDVMAQLVEKLYLSGASVISFDVLFSESAEYDEVLADALWDAANVVLPIYFDGIDENRLEARHITVPVDELLEPVMALGHINMTSDPDGTMRWSPLTIGYDDEHYLSLSLATAALYLQVPFENIDLEAEGGVRLDDDIFIPTDEARRSLINYYGPARTFKYFSIADILNGRVPEEELAGKIVLIGASAAGLFDLRVTPFSPAMPGVEKHASVIASVVEDRFLKTGPFWVGVFMILLTGALYGLIAPRFKAVGASGVACGVLLTVLFAGYYSFIRENLWLNVTYPSLNISLIFISSMAYNYGVEERRARKVKEMFSSYVSERVVEELIKNPEMARLGGERREVTVLFSDIVGFTSFSENNTPEDVVLLLNEYLGEMTDIIFKWEGTLDKFIGDAIMAFWGAPMPQEDHARRAVQCAMDMVQRLEELQKKWKNEGKQVLDCGIGINTGQVVVGNTGSEGKKMDYTIIGDEVNLGARAEGLTREYGERILLTEFTVNKLESGPKTFSTGRMAAAKPIERVTVKGKEKPVEIYKIITV